MRKPIVVKWLWLPFGHGVTLWPFIFVSSKASNPPATFKHECMHWYQIDRMGVLKFYWEILKEYIKHGQYKGPLEVEAYTYKKEPLTDIELNWWNNVR